MSRGNPNNPFAHLAAGATTTTKSNTNGWITTKKRGRDDEQIERDRRLVLESRRRPSSRKEMPKLKKEIRHRQKGHKRSDYSDEEGSMNSLNDFIVNSDEENAEESSSSSDEVESFMVQTTTKKSVPPPPLKKLLNKRQNRNQSGKTSFKTTVDLLSSDEDNIIKNSLLLPRENTYHSTGKPESDQEEKKELEDLDDYLVENYDDLELEIIGRNTGNAQKENTSRNAANDHVTFNSRKSKDGSDFEESPNMFKPHSKRSRNTANLKRILDDSDDESCTQGEDATYIPTQQSADFAGKDEDDIVDEDEARAIQLALKASKREYRLSRKKKSKNSSAVTGNRKTNSSHSNRYNEDQDLQVALKQSEQEYKRFQCRKEKNKMMKGAKKIKRPVSTNRLVESENENSFDEKELKESEESDGDGDAEVDGYVEEAEREAGSVLAAANALSAEVLRTMTGWCRSRSDSRLMDESGIPKGMIVDGALALFTLNMDNETSNGVTENVVQTAENAISREATNSFTSATAPTSSMQFHNKKHEWISQDAMEKICPQLKLADYQLIGVNWLALLNGMKYNIAYSDDETKKKRKGKSKDEGGLNVNGVLADEMGLGKTVQTIAFLAWLKFLKKRQYNNIDEKSVIDVDDSNRYANVEFTCSHPHLIIVPASVLANWEREFQTFCPAMTIVKYHGTMSERREIQSRLRKSLPEANNDRPQQARLPLDVVLTTFSYFSSEKPDDRNFLRKFSWDYMVVDEAHCLKNPKGARYINMDKFSTKRRLLLTGTPVQNSPKELMTLLCFLMPLFTRHGSGGYDDEDSGNDGGARMLQHFVTLETSGIFRDKQPKKDCEKLSDENAYKKLKQLLAPFVLRRKKSEVLHQLIPPKIRKVEFVPFDEATRIVYENILSSHLKARTNEALPSDAATQRHLFTELRKAANHPLLLRTRHIRQEDIEHLSKQLFECGYFGRHATCTQTLVKHELERFSDYDIHCAALESMDENPCLNAELSRYTLNEDDLFCAPKCLRLRSLLPDLRKLGHRMLVFSQWTRCLDLLGCLMDSMGYKFLRLDGSTSIADRQGLIDEFNSDDSIPVFLLSTRAGGMGINLTAADVCILHDLDFNPFNDLQAEDRCHRIGQKKPVTIIKLVTENTVDADIYAMQERKALMNAAILENNPNSLLHTPQQQHANGDAKQNDDDVISTIVQTAMSRFLTSPTTTLKKDNSKMEAFL